MNRGTLLFLSLLFAGCGIESAVVGGTCKAGYVESDGECVVSPSALAVLPPTGGTVTPAPTNAPPVEVPPTIIDPVVTPPTVDPDLLPPDPPVVLVCEAPLVACRGECIPVDGDPLNCGACGRVCPSNICVAGECQGATPGDVVLIGHDMTAALSGSSHARLLVNAVSIPTADPIRVLSFDAADGAANVRSLITTGVKREVRFTTGSAAAVASATYADYDVVLVQGAKGIDPTAVGSSWATAMETFTKKGGVFIALDSGTTDVPALVNATNLLTVGTRTLLPANTRFVVAAPQDVVGQQLLSPFAAFGKSVAFDGVAATADTTWVVKTESGPSLPSVVHKVVW